MSDSIAAFVFLVFMTLYLYDIVKRWKYYRGKPSLLLPRIPHLFQYIWYNFTLGLDYTAHVLYRMAYHTVRKGLWKLNLVQENNNYANQLARVFLDSSLMLYYKPQEGDKDKKLAYFELNEWWIPHDLAPQGKSVFINSFNVTIDLESCSAVLCSVNDSIVDFQTGLQVAVCAWSVVNHPMIHVASTSYGDINHKVPELKQANIYTLAVNMAAVLSSPQFLFMENSENVFAMFEKNLKKGIPHHSFKSLEDIKDYSTTFTFFIQARKIAFFIQKQYKLDVSPEALFLGTVMHALDHWIMAEIVDPLCLIDDSDKRFCSNFDWMFVVAMRSVSSSVKLKNSKVGWHQKFYQLLKEMNEKFANEVDWCVGH